MRLTGIPLILLTGLGGLAALAATVRLWPRGGRPRRLVTRTMGAVLAEVLLVATAGLIINRAQAFYPSWHELLGDGNSAVHTTPPPAVTVALPVDDPHVVLPAGYAGHADVAYPVIVVVCGPASRTKARAAALATPGVVTMVLGPDADPAELTRLQGGLRVIDHDWALVSEKGRRPVAADARFGDGTTVVAADARFGDGTTVVADDDWVTALAAAADRLPPSLAAAGRP